MLQSVLPLPGMARAVLLQERPVLPPPLKWAGGKRWLVPELEKLWKTHEDQRLVEPFAGGLSVALGLRPRDALLNDVNVHVINFYRWLAKGLKLTVPSASDSDTFYANRLRFNQLKAAGKSSSKEAAMLFYYLNRNCYNGLCRFNRTGEFNTPHGRYARPQYVEDLGAYQGALVGWEFRTGDFQKLELKRRDFVYADPPYDESFSDYSKRQFTWEDQKRLTKWLSKHPGPVVISNFASKRILELYQECGFDVSRRLRGPRLISCNGNRTSVEEVLAVRNI